MLNFGSSILAFVVAISVLVSVHEFGHYWVARRLGFKVLRFSIGFGKGLLRWRGRAPDHVEYWVSAIPLGGYVKMLDEREAPVPENERARAFNRRPIPQRIAVLLAGPGFNFLFAIVAYWALFTTGIPGVKPIIGAVEEGSVAARAGLQAGDVVEAVGRESTDTWESATLAIFDELLADARIDLKVRERGGETKDVVLDVRGREAELTEPAALFAGLGIRPEPLVPAVIDTVTPGSAAETAGLRSGDEVLAADDRAIHGWEQWVEFVRSRPNTTVDVRVARDGGEVVLPLTIGQADDNGRTIGRIGASPRLTLTPEAVARLEAEQRYGIVESVPHAIEKTWAMSALTVRMIARMVVGDVSIKNVSGPITIAAYAGDSAKAGLRAFIGFLAVVSISLGILNLMPIPLLDGGQVVYQLVEWLKGSPLSERALALGQQVGVFFLIVLMTFVFYNDLSRLFGS